MSNKPMLSKKCFPHKPNISVIVIVEVVFDLKIQCNCYFIFQKKFDSLNIKLEEQNQNQIC